jgi:small subunit ribosomal protein S6
MTAMPTYESILVFKPVLSDAEVTEFVKKSQEAVVQDGGTVDAHEIWGRRKLTHPIGKNHEALYAYLRFKAAPGLLKRLERDWTLAENVLRHMTSRPVERRPRPVKTKASKSLPTGRPALDARQEAPTA